MNNLPTTTAPVGIAQGDKRDSWQRHISYFEMSSEEAINFTSHGVIPPAKDFVGRLKGTKNKKTVIIWK